MKIAIKFKDHDFNEVYLAFGDVIQDIILHRNYYDIRKNIKELWEESCYGLYILYQNLLDYDSHDERIKTGEWLVNCYSTVYFDEEIDEEISSLLENDNYDLELLYIDENIVKILY